MSQLTAGNYYVARGHISYDPERRDLFRYEDYLPKLVAALAANSAFTSRASLGSVAPNPVMAIWATRSPDTADAVADYVYLSIGGIFLEGFAALANSHFLLTNDWRALEVEFVFQAKRSYSDTEIRRPIADCMVKAFADARAQPQANMAALIEANQVPVAFSLSLGSTPGPRAASAVSPLVHFGHLRVPELQLTRGFIPPAQPATPTRTAPPTQTAPPTRTAPPTQQGAQSGQGWKIAVAGVGVVALAVAVYYATER